MIDDGAMNDNPEAEVWCQRCPATATETYNGERLCHDCAVTLAYKIESPAWKHRAPKKEHNHR